jgi:YfiH family protein
VRHESHPNGPTTWAFEIDGQDLVARVSTRAGGVSTGPYGSLNVGYHVGDADHLVRQNRSRLCAALGIDTIAIPDQQHGTRVALVDEANADAGFASLADSCDRLHATDALVTRAPGVALGIMVADCAPLVLFDPSRHAAGVAHVGRGGAVDDVIGCTIRRMQAEFGTRPVDLHVGVGPCIGADAYEIGGQALHLTERAFDGRFLRPTSPGHATFDLLAAVRARLDQHGVAAANVEVSGTSTDADPALFSDRAERPCGRQMLVVALR